MTGGKLDRRASLSSSHEVLLEGETDSNVEHRRRNGLGDIFQGLSQNDISKLRVHPPTMNRRSLSCPCSSDVTTGRVSKQHHSKRRFHLLHNKRWIRRRMALGHIFAGIPPEKINELLCPAEDKRSFQKQTNHLLSFEDEENVKLLHQRRFGLADIFAGVPEDKIKKIICDSLYNTESRCPISDEEFLKKDIELRFKSAHCRRRCGLGNIFVAISAAEVDKLISKTVQLTTDETIVLENSTDSAIENKSGDKEEYESSSPSYGDKEMDRLEKEDSENNLYMKAFFSSLMKRHCKQRLRRRMSLPCYSQYDMAQQLSTDKRRNGQWDVLSDVTCQEYYSLKGQYVSSVAFASC